MLNEQGVRAQLADVRDALGKMDAERQALQSIEQSLLKWLDLHSSLGEQLPLAKVSQSKHTGSFSSAGAISLADAVTRALRNREGSPMETRDILSTAESMGAVTTSKDPIRTIEWVIYDIKRKKSLPIRRVKPHVFVYEKSPALEI